MKTVGVKAVDDTFKVSFYQGVSENLILFYNYFVCRMSHFDLWNRKQPKL